MPVRTLTLVSFLVLAAAEVLADTCSSASFSALRPPRYPASALADQAAGEVKVSVFVETDGTARNVTVIESSGRADFDAAAIESVKMWRFEPKACDGVKQASTVIVPVTFTHVTPAEVREVARDEEPMEFSGYAEGEEYLQNKPGVSKQISPSGFVSYTLPHSTRSWKLIDLSPAPARFILRTRMERRGETLRELFAIVCEGPDDWCANVQVDQLKLMQEHPMPLPPTNFGEVR